jgi:hypothetical protein
LFKVKTPVRGSYAVYGWRWPASSSYNDQAVFWIWTTNGWARRP